MYDEDSTRRRLRLGEDSVTEFKGVVACNCEPDGRDLAKAIGALANTRGGILFLGVENDGTPTGVGTVEQADRLMVRVAQICANAIRPALACAFRKVALGETILLLVEVPGFSPERPYLANSVYYVRRGAQSEVATGQELRRSLESSDYHHDGQTVHGAAPSDLDDDAIDRLLAGRYGAGYDRGRRDHYLRSLAFLDESGLPTVAGILFVGVDPARFLPYARVSAVRFPGTVLGGDFADRQEIGGRLTGQIEAATEFLVRHLASPSHVEGFDRVGVSGPGLLPEVALREALLNTVSHRDYRATSQTTIFVFDDRVEFTNPGQLLNRLTLDSIRLGGIKQHRNPVIASILSQVLSTRRESLGIGVPEMIRAMKERGLPEPEFEVAGGHFRVVLRAREPARP